MQLRQKIRRQLESFDFFLRIRYADFFLKFFLKKETIQNLAKEKKHYFSFLSKLKNTKNATVFDVGANEGFISKFFLDAHFKVLAIEPDVRNQKILEARFGGNPNFKIIKKGLSEEEGSAPFFQHKKNSAFNTFSKKWKSEIDSKTEASNFLKEKMIVELTTLDRLIELEGIPVFVKIDVEGHELEVIRGLSQKIPLLSFEANWPQFRAETFAIIDRLEQICPSSQFNFSKKFELKLAEFVSGKKLKNELDSIEGEACVEIFCKMSNYSNFFHS